ncbi:MAG TPA: hypothetical protein VM364_07875 [Vicinamibacterales bacterium]|nr:hypothetical protein [Vicinamibacterales bacterium]
MAIANPLRVFPEEGAGTTHPRADDLQLEIDGELQPESRVFGDDDEPLFALADAWRKLLEGRGWS